MADTRLIAIVDDHIMFRKGLISLINLFPNYEVSLDADNGKDFIAKLRADRLPDIALLDINMPEMDGYTTAEWLRSNHPQIKVLALSTMDSDTAIIRMIKMGATGYVLKDADPSELKLAFDEVMRSGYFYNDLITRKVMRSINKIDDDNDTGIAFVRLTARELEFLKYTCTELTYKEIADRMSVSVRTVEGYRDGLCEKLNLKTRVGLALYAVKNHLVRL